MAKWVPAVPAPIGLLVERRASILNQALKLPKNRTSQERRLHITFPRMSTIHRWRWDQGRLAYFEFTNLCHLAKVLASLEGSPLDLRGADPLRADLVSRTGLPFLPEAYRVWRNYARVFACATLAVKVEGRLICTELGRNLASEGGRTVFVDEYLGHLVPRLQYPLPTFEHYEPDQRGPFPLALILKLLIGRWREGRIPSAITIEEIFRLLVASGCRGDEPTDRLLALKAKDYSPAGDEFRQLRELVVFFSQASFLKWRAPELVLDIPSVPEAEGFVSTIEALAEPIIEERRTDPAEEILRLGRLPAHSQSFPVAVLRLVEADQEFVEGRRVRVNHLVIERSPKLRQMYFAAAGETVACNMCALLTMERYPWARNILEVHHLLPLSSTIALNLRGTSLEDLVALCPSCHRATHLFYSVWLRQRLLDDFPSKAHAHDAYEEAKGLAVV